MVGAPATPTPRRLFSIVRAWRSDPDAFVGSWVLGLTAHSDVLRHFEGGSGEAEAGADRHRLRGRAVPGLATWRRSLYCRER